jgi:hypothetical protein
MHLVEWRFYTLKTPRLHGRSLKPPTKSALFGFPPEPDRGRRIPSSSVERHFYRLCDRSAPKCGASRCGASEGRLCRGPERLHAGQDSTGCVIRQLDHRHINRAALHVRPISVYSRPRKLRREGKRQSHQSPETCHWGPIATAGTSDGGGFRVNKMLKIALLLTVLVALVRR